MEVCAQIFKSLQVNADGSVFRVTDYNNNLGNVLDKSLLEIWGHKLSELRMLHLEERGIPMRHAVGDMNELSDIEFIDDHVDQIKLMKLFCQDSRSVSEFSSSMLKIVAGP